MIVPVVLCGGSGTRLWPLSRQDYPKQLLSLVSERSLLQDTVLRIAGETDVDAPLLICNEAHRFLVAEQMREIGVSPRAIILEPEGRNTAPAVALALAWATNHEPGATLIVLPSDHVIRDEAAFRSAVKYASELAGSGYLVTFGVKAETPETGYGYVERGDAINDHGYALTRFVEKPSKERAQEYLDSGRFSWNGGMFAFSVEAITKAFQQFASPIYDAVSKAWENSAQDQDFVRPDSELFAACPSDSIDYAIMEKTDHAAIVPLDAGWSDVGSWSALWEVSSKDDFGNVARGDVIVDSATNNFVHASHRLVAVAGIEGVTVIETADAVLVAGKDASQGVKEIVNTLVQSSREESVSHRRVYRPWGWYEGVDHGERHQVKRICVNPAAKLSLQKHHHRAEHWIVVSGTARVTCDDQIFELFENQSTYIPQGSVHRLENLGTLPLEIIEVQSGSYLGEDDIVRFEDNYGRA